MKASKVLCCLIIVDHKTKDVQGQGSPDIHVRSKDFFFTLCGYLIPFTRVNAQWIIHGFN